MWSWIKSFTWASLFVFMIFIYLAMLSDFTEVTLLGTAVALVAGLIHTEFY